MNRTIEVDEQTHRTLEFAARMSRCTAGEVVARLVAEASMPTPSGKADTTRPGTPDTIKVYADYQGHRTHGTYDPDTTRIDITSGPLAGQSFKTPTGAAGAVVGHYNPGVNPSRNGWTFWVVDDDAGRFLKSMRTR